MGDPIASFSIRPIRPPKAPIFSDESAGDWKLTIFDDHLRLEPPNAPAVEFPRAELSDRVSLVNNLFLRRVLMVALDRRTAFQLEPEVFRIIQNWIGPPTRADLLVALKKRMLLDVLAGILYLFLAFTVVKGGVGIQIFNGILGGSLLLSSFVALVAPSRVYFLVDTICFAWIAIVIAVNLSFMWPDIAWRGRLMDAFFVLIFLVAILNRVNQFLRFSSPKIGSQAACE